MQALTVAQEEVVDYQPIGLHQLDATTRTLLAGEQRALASALDRTMAAAASGASLRSLDGSVADRVRLIGEPAAGC